VHLTIAMLTYRRNDYLAQVIPELLAQADDVCDAQTTASVLIVDNDPQAGARAVVEAARAALAGGQPLQPRPPYTTATIPLARHCSRGKKSPDASPPRTYATSSLTSPAPASPTRRATRSASGAKTTRRALMPSSPR